MKKYTTTIFNLNETSICLTRIRRPLSYFETQGVERAFVRGVFMFVANEPDLALRNQYGRSGKEFLYTGSFHQFAAYAAWISKNGFIPLRLFHASREKIYMC